MRDRRILFVLIALVLLPSLALTEEAAIRRLPRQDGKVLERRCPVHHEVMAVDVVPIHYGMLPPEAAGLGPTGPRPEVEAYWRERKASFPEIHRHAAGGCIVGPEREAEVYACRACREAEAAWLKRHPGVSPARP